MQSRKRLYTVIISLVVLTGFMVTSLIGYFVARDLITDRLQQEMLPLTSDNIYSEIQRDLLQPVLISSMMANDTFVVDWVHTGEEEPEKMQRYLAQIQNKYKTITAFFVSENTHLYYHADGIIKQVSDVDPADKWYFDARDIDKAYEINIDNDTADPSRLNIFVNYRVVDKQGQLIGVIGVGLSMETVQGLIESYQQRYGREIYFVDRQGEVMLHSSHYSKELHQQNQAELDKLFTRLLTSSSDSVSLNADNGNVIYLNSRFVSEFGWYLIVEQINDPSSEQIETALIINVLVSVAMSLVVLLLAHLTLRGYQRRLENMATKDKLTGTASRQVFELLFSRVIKMAARRNTPTSLMLIDIDHFKQVNDNYGHQRGDEALRACAQLIKQHIRDVDILCRWGGEEFLLVFENCHLSRAIKIAENIRYEISHHTFQFADESLRLTVSAGVAEYRRDESMKDVIARCDRALYSAKHAGRDQVKSEV